MSASLVGARLRHTLSVISSIPFVPGNIVDSARMNGKKMHGTSIVTDDLFTLPPHDRAVILSVNDRKGHDINFMIILFFICFFAPK